MKQTLNILRGWSWLMLLALLAGCSNDSDEPEPPQPENPKQSLPLTFEVTENPMIIDGAENHQSTRTPITTFSQFNKFYMNYVYNGSIGSNDPDPVGPHVKAEKNGVGKWVNSAGSDKGWPIVDPKEMVVNWYAYTGYSSDSETNLVHFYRNGGTPYLDFTVDADVASQHDLLVAQTSGTWNDTSGILELNFNHVCSALRLFIKKSTNLSAYTLSVSNVTLCNVVNQGYYYFGTETWTLPASRASYDIYPGSEPQTLGSTDYIPMDGDQSNNEATHTYLFMIPQTLTAWDGTTAIASATTQSYLEIECTITKTSDSSQVYRGTAYIPFGASLAKGTQYDVKINIGKNSLYKYDEETHTYIKIIN